MRVDPDKPGWWQLLHGEGEPSMQTVAWIGTLTCAFLVALGLFSLVGA
jgi:hypothetical protein